MVMTKESTPPPIIGKAGRYTVFLTPPSTASPSPATPKPLSQFKSESPKTPPSPPFPPPLTPIKTVPPPVQPPPQQFEKSTSFHSKSDSSMLGFFRNAVAKVQNAHSSLDGFMAEWFGLDHSKYQWALDDYYETKGVVKGDTKAKGMAPKGQSV